MTCGSSSAPSSRRASTAATRSSRESSVLAIALELYAMGRRVATLASYLL